MRRAGARYWQVLVPGVLLFSGVRLLVKEGAVKNIDVRRYVLRSGAGFFVEVGDRGSCCAGVAGVSGYLTRYVDQAALFGSAARADRAGAALARAGVLEVVAVCVSTRVVVVKGCLLTTAAERERQVAGVDRMVEAFLDEKERRSMAG